MASHTLLFQAMSHQTGLIRSHHSQSQSSNASPDSTQEIILHEDEDGLAASPWKKFDILPDAPHDHAFFSFVSNQPSKNFLARLTKSTVRSQPPCQVCIIVRSSHLLHILIKIDSILVCAYEDLTDLLRCLIIAPQNTPYEDAPFVIDWMLDSNFPKSPPIAHFLSWTNGNGRVPP
jgi:ubiquitin-conjugating enzyme E2 O